MGLGYHQLRMVGWYRSRGYADFSNLTAVPPGMANRGEPCGRSDDDLRGNVRGPVPDMAYGSGVDGVFCSSLPKYQGFPLGELQLAAIMGRICDLNIFYRLASVLVFGFNS